MQQTRIRLCTERDLPVVKRLAGNSFKQEKWFYKKNLLNILRENRETCWVLEKQKKVCGARFVFDDTDGRAWGWLLVVAKGERRKGLATTLWKKTCVLLKKKGFRKLYGDTEASNIASINWHLKNGYTVDGFFSDWYGKGEHAVVFSIDL